MLHAVKHLMEKDMVINMKQPEILIIGIEKIKPITVLKYDESNTHNDVSVPGVVKRAKEETEKLVKRK